MKAFEPNKLPLPFFERGNPKRQKKLRLWKVVVPKWGKKRKGSRHTATKQLSKQKEGPKESREGQRKGEKKSERERERETQRAKKGKHLQKKVQWTGVPTRSSLATSLMSHWCWWRLEVEFQTNMHELRATQKRRSVNVSDTWNFPHHPLFTIGNVVRERWSVCWDSSKEIQAKKQSKQLNPMCYITSNT